MPEGYKYWTDGPIIFLGLFCLEIDVIYCFYREFRRLCRECKSCLVEEVSPLKQCSDFVSPGAEGRSHGKSGHVVGNDFAETEETGSLAEELGSPFHMLGQGLQFLVSSRIRKPFASDQKVSN